MVYASASLSLATLELLVHTQDLSVIIENYIVIPIQFDAAFVDFIADEQLPDHWSNPQVHVSSQLFGDRWAQSQSNPVARVPSVVIENEYNYLLNPMHPDFSDVAIGEARFFNPDLRLIMKHCIGHG